MIVNGNVRAILALKSNRERRAVIDLMKDGQPLPVALMTLAAANAVREVQRRIENDPGFAHT